MATAAADRHIVAAEPHRNHITPAAELANMVARLLNAVKAPMAVAV